MKGRWRIELLDYPEKSTGDVMTWHGEIIGTWKCDDDDDFLEFFPLGAQEPVASSYMLGLLCFAIADWFNAQPGNDHLG